MTSSRLDGWMPMRVYSGDRTLMVDWCLLRRERLTDPFFEQTVERCLRRPFNLAFRRQTTVDELVALARLDPAPRVAGLVFHMSRCGSTLVAQMLAALEEHVVISEAGPIDGILRAPAPSPEVRAEWLRAMVNAIARSQGPDARQVFVKFDSWHTLALPLVRLAFPDTPWIFLYREPADVLASQARQPGIQTVPGSMPAALFGIDPDDVSAMALGEYGAHVIAAICRAALQHCDDQALFVNYRELPGALAEIVTHFGLDTTDDALRRMIAAAAYDAKAPSLSFVPTSVAAPSELRDRAERLLRAPYDALEAANDAAIDVSARA